MASLYVGNLDPECNEAMLFHKFAPIGDLVNINVRRDKTTGRNLGHAFINFASKIDAERAMSKLNYSVLKGRSIRLMWAEKNKKLPPNANIFVKNLDINIDEKALYVIFASYGDILSIKLATNENGSSKGYAFIQYVNDKSADEAIREVNQKILRGRIVQVAKFIPRDQRSSVPYHNIYIKNLDSALTEEDLLRMCEKYGEILSAKVMRDDNGNSKNFGFISFKSSESAEEAVKEMNGKEVNGRKLFADRAKKKAERQKEVTETEKLKWERRGTALNYNRTLKNI